MKDKDLHLDLGPTVVAGLSATAKDGVSSIPCELSTTQIQKSVWLLRIRCAVADPSSHTLLQISFSFPSIDLQGHWNPRQHAEKASYYRNEITSGLTAWAPVMCYYNSLSRNRITFALSETTAPVTMQCTLREEDQCFYVSIELNKPDDASGGTYELELHIDTRDVPFHDALDAARAWWESGDDSRPAPAPEAARRPAYSTWYAYHQSLDEDGVVADCTLAKALGCQTVIIDDGWQTSDSSRGYAYTGDWKPERIPDMAGWVQRIHDQGMQALLWYALPFVGARAENYPRFRDQTLHYWAATDTYVLDPRYPEVREFLIDTLVTALSDWRLDGFKLDFIEWFRAFDDTVATIDDGRDIACVTHATQQLMTSLMNNLSQHKPDEMIEFRQPYVGPSMRPHGNIFRATDCANNAAANRAQIVNLRLLSGRTAIHADMLAWHPDEPAHIAALQLLAVMFSVPQVSVRLDRVSPEHRAMLKFWLGYWNEHREILLDGIFMPASPSCGYPTITAMRGGHQISAVYDPQSIVSVQPDAKQIDVLNATGAGTIRISCDDLGGEFELTAIDCYGTQRSREILTATSGAHRLATPQAGLLRLKRQ